MVSITFIGNLAADAEIKGGNGKDWLTFRLADTRKFTDAQGNQHEVTQWASCIMQAQQGTLIQYLKKGVKVCVQGSSDIEIYSSPKLKRMVARYNISVQHVELCGGSSDTVPRKLVAPDGQLIDVYKAYYINPAVQANEHYTELLSPGGGAFTVDANGFVWEQTSSEGQQEEAQPFTEQADTEPQNNNVGQSAAQPATAKKNGSKKQ